MTQRVETLKLSMELKKEEQVKRLSQSFMLTGALMASMLHRVRAEGETERMYVVCL